MTAIGAILRAPAHHVPRPLVVIVGGDDASRLAAVVALPLSDAILIGHQDPLPADLIGRTRRIEHIATSAASASFCATHVALEQSLTGAAFAVSLQEQRDHLLVLDLDRPSALDGAKRLRSGRPHGNDNVPSLLTAVETLLRLLTERQQTLRIDTLNDECPLSVALGCGTLRPQALRADAGVSAVVVPLIPRDCDAAVANFEIWNDPQSFPRDCDGPSQTDLVFVFNCAPDPQLESRLEDAFSASAAARRCFRTMRVAFLGLEGEDDRYIRRASGPMPRYGYKAGPNLLFFGALSQLRQWGYGGFAALLEVDCRPLRRGWLDALDRLAKRHADAWVVGSIYRGHGILGSSIKRHLNGNALYAVGSAGFHDFLENGYLSWLQSQITQREADLAFDTAWDRFLESADPERANTAEWRVAQHVLPRFVTCDEIVNIAGDPEIRGQIAFSRETLRRAFPSTYMVHGPIAPEDRNLDVTTLSEALSRMAFDNAIGHAAQGLIIEEWLAAPGLSRRSAASWNFATPGPEAVGGILLTVSDGLMVEGSRLVAHVAVRADRRTMLRFSLAPGTGTWGASSRDIFLAPSATKRFRIELTLAESARYIAFRVSSASADTASPLSIDFDELRFELLGADGQHEGGLSLGLTSVEAANYGALSVIGSTPVPPEGGASQPATVAAAVPESDTTVSEWVPRLHLSEADDAGLRTLAFTATGGDLDLARMEVDQGKLVRLVLLSSGSEAAAKIPVPASVDDLIVAAETTLPDAQRTAFETLAVYWQQIAALVAGDQGEKDDTLSPDAAAAAKADPAGLVAALDPLWHRPAGRRHIDQVLTAILGDGSAGAVPFSGLFRSLRRIVRSEDSEAGWRVAQAAIEGGKIPLPKGTAVAVAATIHDAGRLQVFANHMSSQGEHEAAAEICRISVAEGNAPRDAYLVLARSEAVQGRSAAAGVALRLGVARYPSDQTLIMDLVKWHGDQGQVDQAGDAAWKLAQTRPEHPDVIAEVASRLLLAGRHDEVIAFGEAYLSGEPDLRLALSMLSAASQSGRHADALRLARLAVKFGAPDVHVAGPIISAAARLWDVEGAADFAEKILTRDGGTLLASLLDARLRVFERQRADDAIDAAGVAAVLDWIDARRGMFADDLKIRAMDLGACCATTDAVMRGIRQWHVRLAPHDAAAIARSLLGRGGVRIPASDEQLVDLLVSTASLQIDRDCQLLLAVSIMPGSSALQLAGHLVGFQTGDEELVRRHGLLQTGGPFDRMLPLWPLRTHGRHWPAEAMPGFSLDETSRRARRNVDGQDNVVWPTISVVLPSLNQKSTIEDSLLSILNQGYPAVEVVVVDGGSDDGTLDVLGRYADRVRTIVAPGLSQSAALSAGFKETTAELLGWLNTDDLFLPGALFAVANLWLTATADVIVGDCLHFRDDNIVDVVVADRKRPPLNSARLLDIERNWLQGRYFTQPEVFFSRAAYEKAGGYVDGGLNYAMDYELWLRMASGGASSVTLPRALAAFRRHSGQKTARQYEAFAELVQVRNRHLAAPAIGPSRSNLPSGTLALCPWDAPAGSPLAALAAAGKRITLPAATPDADGAIILDPMQAHAHGGPVLDIIGLGGPLPQASLISEQLRLRTGQPVVWMWTPEVNFADKLRLSRLFGRVIPTNATSGAYLHNLDPHLDELLECSTLDPLRTGRPFRQSGEGKSGRWLHLQHGAEDGFVRFLPGGARIMRPSALYSTAQGDGETARELLASHDVVSMTALGRAVPGMAYDTAALGCRTLVVAPEWAAADRALTETGVCLSNLPGNNDEAAALTDWVIARDRPTLSEADDLVTRARSFVETHG